MRIGMVGLGAMGSAFAVRLLAAGHAVTAWNRSPGPFEAVVRAGGEAAPSIEAAFEADATLSMLADDEAYREVFPSGTLARLPRGAVHAGMATLSLALVREMAAAHVEHGLTYVAAPVIGNSAMAREAGVHVLASGDPAALARARPALEAVGQSLREFGLEPERAAAAKIVANFVLGSAVETLAEALALGGAHGLAAGALVEMLTGTSFAAPAYRVYGAAMAEGRFEPPAFRLRLAAKDLGLALAAAQEAGVPLPVAGVVREALGAALRHGDGDKDLAVLAQISAHRARQT